MLKSNKGSRFDGEIKESAHFCYICVKKHDADKIAALNWDKVVEEVIKEQEEDGLGLEDEEAEEAGTGPDS